MSLVGAIILELLGFVLAMVFIICIIIIYYEYCQDEDKRMGIMSIFISVFFISIAVTGISVGIFFTAKEYNTSYERVEYEIYSLERGTETDGSFTLGSGSIETHIAYYFYIETERGFELKNITNEGTKIYLVETEEKAPSIVTKKDSKNFEKYKVIYVPIGTIVKAYAG